MKRGLLSALVLSAGLVFAAPAVALAEDITLDGTQEGTQFIIGSDETNTITVKGDVKLNGEGDAFTISKNTQLIFEPGASLTLTGYDNAFVVNNATLSGGGWNITDGDGMDLFRLQSNGELEVNGNVTLNGAGNTNTTSRAIVLESGSGQAVTLAADATLAANGFYRGMETGGASGYTISGGDMETSVFDFSGNDCGMALSYFDSNATFEHCKLEVSNCLSSGIFMRQDNAALDGLFIDHVDINCVNNQISSQKDIAVRFHSNDFKITNSNIYIEDAWNTGTVKILSHFTTTP